ncbi:hypothetical protein CJD36_006895 [Flavipsychrobacter stenotrophus]|uniref:Uncharacterized protein n=1 Tax=Flavipsychrobacter stenotrophus TaxID=2077091 RepID=A0A2S7SX72_9BACT|nr:hypothetical protein CJD36_006895 [Flavipsychrobacter stenotrophus]
MYHKYYAHVQALCGAYGDINTFGIAFKISLVYFYKHLVPSASLHTMAYRVVVLYSVLFNTFV